MRTIFRAFRKLLRRDDGPTAVEYAVMLALIVLACLAAITKTGTKAKNTFNKVSKSL